jgi:hypothetical protein
MAVYVVLFESESAEAEIEDALAALPARLVGPIHTVPSIRAADALARLLEGLKLVALRARRAASAEADPG